MISPGFAAIRSHGATAQIGTAAESGFSVLVLNPFSRAEWPLRPDGLAVTTFVVCCALAGSRSIALSRKIVPQFRSAFNDAPVPISDSHLN